MPDKSVSHQADALVGGPDITAEDWPVANDDSLTEALAETGDVTGLVTRVASHPSDKSISILLVEVAVDSVGKGPIIISTP